MTNSFEACLAETLMWEGGPTTAAAGGMAQVQQADHAQGNPLDQISKPLRPQIECRDRPPTRSTAAPAKRSQATRAGLIRASSSRRARSACQRS